MNDSNCVELLQWALPQLRMRWPGFRKVRRQIGKRIDRRMRELGLSEAEEYQSFLINHPQEWLILDGFCRITISRFYRDRGVFDALGRAVLSQLAEMCECANERQINCWSAGCASGEEPYSVKMIWHYLLQPKYPKIKFKIFATDADDQMVWRAQNATYERSSLKELKNDWIDQAFDRVDSQFRLKDAFRTDIDWLKQDIRNQMPAGPFHLILCRHLVFTYFDLDLQTQLLAKFLHRLRAGGFLITGKQEKLPELPEQLQVFKPHIGIYCKRNGCPRSKVSSRML